MLETVSGWLRPASQTEELKRAEAEAKGLYQKNANALRDVAQGVAYVFQQAQTYVQKNPRTIDKGVDALIKVVVLVKTAQAVATNPYYTIFGCLAGGIVSPQFCEVAKRLFQMHEHLSPSSKIFIDMAAGYTIHYLPVEMVASMTGGIVSANVVDQAKGKLKNA